MSEPFESPFAYRDEFGSVAKAYHLCDQWSDRHARFALWADSALDAGRSVAEPRIDLRDEFTIDDLAAWIAKTARFYDKKARRKNKSELAPRPEIDPVAEWTAMRNHPMWGFLVEAAKDAAGGWIDDPGEFIAVVRAECAELRRMVREQKPTPAALSALKDKFNRR
jgi:hypothetical protein